MLSHFSKSSSSFWATSTAFWALSSNSLKNLPSLGIREKFGIYLLAVFYSTIMGATAFRYQNKRTARLSGKTEGTHFL
jgi:hypothetical protein